MNMDAAPNDGMGSLYYGDGRCRFRVWAPFAKKVQVIGDFTNWQEGLNDLNDEGNGNW
jgi:1,4-alpha-glucan branching enzyme